jgi:hypothetical protein
MNAGAGCTQTFVSDPNHEWQTPKAPTTTT